MARNMRRFREMFHVPAERMEYYYMLREDMPEPIEGIIGYIVNDSCEGLKILLEVDDDYLKSRHAYDPTLYLDPEAYLSECRIVLNKRLARLMLKKDPAVIFSLWHELGHFHTMEDHVEEYLNCTAAAEGGFTAEQYVAIMDGIVLPGEAAADDFAVDYCGRQESVIAINGLIAACKKNPATMNDRGTIKSLLNRKNRITRMEGEQ